MQKKNLGFLFNDLYYRNKDQLTYSYTSMKKVLNNNSLEDAKYENRNKEILNYEFREVKLNKENLPWTHVIKMRTTYPGLVTGIGLSHGIGINNEFKNGFQFDFTTGLPYLPGSGVKGMLRSFFDGVIKSNSDKSLENFNNFFKIHFKDLKNLQDFVNVVFNEEKLEKPTVFFDAWVVTSENKSKKILEADFITPHWPLKDPNPIKILKIRPNVVMEFRFRLIDNHWLTANEQLKLFNDILLIYGVGAKTNVGYGYFDEDYSNKYIKEFYEKIEKERQRQVEKEKAKILEELEGFEKEKYLYNLEKENMNQQERIQWVVLMIKEIEKYEKPEINAKFLKNELIELKKWKKWGKKKDKFKGRKRYNKIVSYLDE